MKFAIILDNKLAHKYESNKKESFGGAWGSEQATQVEIPESIALEHAQWDGEKIIEVIPYESPIEKRIKAYNSEGCSRNEIIDALIQKEFDNDNTLWNAIDAKRKEIKLRFPKD